MLDGNKADVLQLGGHLRAGRRDWAGLDWLDGFLRWEGINPAKNKGRDRQETDWTEGIEALSGKATFSSPSPKRQRQTALLSAFFSTYYTFLPFFFFFFCFPRLSFSFLLSTLLFSIPKVPFSIAGLTMNGYLFVWSFLSRPLVGLSLSSDLPAYLRLSTSTGTREITAGDGEGGQGSGRGR